MSQIYQSIGIKKQSFHQMLGRRNYAQEETGQLLYLVDQIRKDHPRMAVREIYRKLMPSSMGRDKFEKMCLSHGYRVMQKRNFRKTTDSTGVTRFPNRIKEIEVTSVNQVFVSDITYYELKNEFYYLTFIMDLFNREIVGFHASEGLRTEQTTLPALYMMVKERGKANLKGTVIHSDGGGQYYSKEFCELTGKLEMVNSMTEETVYENAHAERLNGIIKNNYLYPYAPVDLEDIRKKLKKAVKMYNTEKSHIALGGKTPVQYRVNAIETEDNNACYLPFSTAKRHQHKYRKIMSNLVNVI
jgi:transposase InsO family protein